MRFAHLLSLSLLAAALLSTVSRAEILQWQDVVRQSPYWHSQGSHQNLMTLRGWMLMQQDYCDQNDRHVFFDHRGQFLSFIVNEEETELTQIKINDKRQQLFEQGHTAFWLAGYANVRGYPFAISCDQPMAYLGDALTRFLGEFEQDRFHGSWDGLVIGSPDDQVSLQQALERVYQHRRLQGRTEMPEQVVSLLAAKLLIESGGRSNALSSTQAKGIMQLMPAVLSDCEIPPAYHYHRIAQMDCAFRLLEQNHRNLRPSFEQTFGHLPAEKAERLYSLLLVQAYHGGIGRIRSLLINPDFNGPAQYFAAHHERFTAGDIALGLVFHNMGRNALGFASMYYLSDVGIAHQLLCERQAILGCDLDELNLANQP